MRPPLRSTSAIAAVLCLTGSVSAQLVITPVQAQFGGRRGTSIFVQPRVAPFPPGWGSSNGFWSDGGGPWWGGPWAFHHPATVFQYFFPPAVVGGPLMPG